MAMFWRNGLENPTVEFPVIIIFFIIMIQSVEFCEGFIDDVTTDKEGAWCKKVMIIFFVAIT